VGVDVRAPAGSMGAQGAGTGAPLLRANHGRGWLWGALPIPAPGGARGRRDLEGQAQLAWRIRCGARACGRYELPTSFEIPAATLLYYGNGRRPSTLRFRKGNSAPGDNLYREARWVRFCRTPQRQKRKWQGADRPGISRGKKRRNGNWNFGTRRAQKMLYEVTINGERRNGGGELLGKRLLLHGLTATKESPRSFLRADSFSGRR